MKSPLSMLGALCAIVLLYASPAPAQVSEQPTLFTYVALWGVPRDQWADMGKLNSSEDATLGKLVDDGTLVGYGHAEYNLHDQEGWTHGEWFQATSVGGILKTLDALRATSSASPVLAKSRHLDLFLQSTMYGFRPGTIHDGYMWRGFFQIKAGHAEDWIHWFGVVIRPVFDELVANGTVTAYELDTELVHSKGQADTLGYGYITTDPNGIDKVQAAIRAAEVKTPTFAAAIGPLEESEAHYDSILRVNLMRHK